MLQWNPDDDLTAAVLDPSGVSVYTAACDAFHGADVDPPTFGDGPFLRVKISGRRPEVILWDAATGKRVRNFKGHVAPIMALALSPSGRMIAAAAAAGYVPSHPEALRAVTALETRRFSGRDLTAHPEGGLVQLWDAATAQELYSLAVPGNGIGPIAFSPDGTLLEAYGVGFGITAWDVNSGRAVITLRMSERQRAKAAPGESKEWLCVDWRHLVLTIKNRVLRGRPPADAAGPFLAIKPESPVPSLRCVAFSPDGQRFVTANEFGNVRVWDSATGKSLAGVDFRAGVGDGDPSRAGTPTFLTFSPDGSRVVAGTDGGLVTVWDAQKLHPLHSVQGPRGRVNTVSFVGDRLRILSGGSRHGRFDTDPKTGLMLREPLTLWEAEIGPHRATH